MKTRIKTALSLAVLLIAFGLLQLSFHLMNLPRDSAFYGGVSLVLGMFVIVPAIFASIWRR